MKVALLIAGLVLTVRVHADVIPLPGSTPQRAQPDTAFPNPVSLRVTDGQGAPVAGAVLSWQSAPPGFQAVFASGVDCPAFRMWACSARTGADGVAHLGRFWAAFESTTVLRMRATSADDRIDYGFADIVLKVGAGPLPPTIAIVQGAGQVARIGAYLPQPIVVRVVDEAGAGVAGRRVRFFPEYFNESRGFRDPNLLPPAIFTDADGHATAPPFFAGWAPGDFHFEALADDPSGGAHSGVSGHVAVLNVDGTRTITLQNLWWSGPMENGWGLSVVQHGDQLFSVLFVYDDEGRPTWYVMPDGSWTQGVGSTFSGSLYATQGSPFWAYDAARFAVRHAGSALLEFRGASRASLRTVFGSLAGSKSLVPQDFPGERPAPLLGLADMWWGGPAQNGWGVAIHEQAGNLFAVWFTYDGEGRPTWFVMPGGEWQDASTYSGTMYRTRGSPWIGTAYDASRLSVEPVGPYSLRFASAAQATLDYNVDGRSGRISLVRQPFARDE